MSKWNDFLVSANRSIFSQSHTHRILLERILLEVPRGGSVVETGCGMAYISNLLADIGFDTTAGDIDIDVLESAKSNVEILKNPVEYKKIDLMDLRSDYAPKHFDAIIHSGVMEHFFDADIIHSLTEQNFVAKVLVFKVPNSRTKKSPGHFGDERFLTNDHWVRLLRAGGYKDIKVIGGESLPEWTHLLPSILHMYPKHNQSKRKIRLLELLSKWRRIFSKHTIFVCR